MAVVNRLCRSEAETAMEHVLKIVFEGQTMLLQGRVQHIHRLHRSNAIFVIKLSFGEFSLLM